MTLENCQKLLKHFNDLADGTIPKPFGHKNWEDVVYNAKVRVKRMKIKLERYNSEEFRMKHGLPEPIKPKETKSKGAK